ncbi:uncharacterized protein SOCE26_073930 [Sorangium cellulosum]|uniref:Uncharacterized protein n=1 Tax=Sorangium cellulosum TaxID=56 RepID=A0A2L0F2Y6_SORCE|nr:uncharacterized protein SOCE26_073930 [Sorangium cellulosum]
MSARAEKRCVPTAEPLSYIAERSRTLAIYASGGMSSPRMSATSYRARRSRWTGRSST